MIVANTAAMQPALALSSTVDADAILAMHRALMVNESRHTPGELRTEPVWIGGGSIPVGRHSSARATRWSLGRLTT